MISHDYPSMHLPAMTPANTTQATQKQQMLFLLKKDHFAPISTGHDRKIAPVYSKRNGLAMTELQLNFNRIK